MERDGLATRAGPGESLQDGLLLTVLTLLTG